ncbi:hypothetical protein FACS189419_01650 [Planctomycetales bacterium]|nr:hypothetical protein FACS189419_01650 [Planctomycetales bacterium]
MGLFTSSNKKKQDYRSRLCRIEVLETREFLDAAPYMPPPDVNVGAVYHEDYYLTGSTAEDTLGDTFVVSWNGGAAGTKLTELTIDLSTYDVDEKLYFNINSQDQQGSNGNAFPFTLTGDSDFQLGDFSFFFSNSNRTLTIRFDQTDSEGNSIDFTADKVLKFKVDVNSISNNTIEVIVPGQHFERSVLNATFESADYNVLTINKQFVNDYTIPDNSNLNVPPDGFFPDGSGTSRGAATAGAIAAGQQTPLSGSISGYVYEDSNNDGIKDAAEKGLADVWLELYYKDANGDYVSTNRAEKTDASGFYLFDGIAGGRTYMVREMTQPDGYHDGKETPGTINGEQVGQAVYPDDIAAIHIGANQNGINYNFGEYKGVSISGNVYEDTNNDGIRDKDENGLKDVIIYLCEVLPDGTQQNITHTVTDADGKYSFENLDPSKTYCLTEIDPEGYCDGKNALGTVDGNTVGEFKPDPDAMTNIVLGSGQSGIEYNFAENRKGTLSGFVYIDANEDGVKNDGEQGIQSVVLTLWVWSETEGKYIQTSKEATTNGAGYYQFEGLCPFKKYQILETQPTAYQDGDESVGTIGGNTVGTVSESENDIISNIDLPPGGAGINYNFGEKLEDVPPPPPPPPPPPGPEPGSISGYVYVDTDKNGYKADTEAGIGGVTIVLEKLVNGKYEYAGMAKTGVGGFYIFRNLDADETYRVSEIQPVGYVDGLDREGSLGGIVTDDVISGILLPEKAVAENYNFGENLPPNDPPPTIPPTTPPPPTYEQFRRVAGGSGLTGMPGAVSWQTPMLNNGLRTDYGGGGMVSPDYSWHLSVVNGGYPRENGNSDGLLATTYSSQTTQILPSGTDLSSEVSTRYVSVAWTPLPINQSGWYVRDKAGNVRKMYTFGPDGGIPLVGDFNGDGIDELAVFQNGNWYIDINGNGQWDEEDLWSELGTAGDLPVVGDWDGDGKADIGIFGRQWDGDAEFTKDEPGLPSDLNRTITARPKNVPPNVTITNESAQVRTMKHSQNGGVRLDVIDHVFQYGTQGDRAVTGDFSGDGITKIGVYRDGKWYLDKNGNGKWDAGDIYVDNADFGLGPEGVPVVGDFNGDGIDNIGLYVNGIWHLDTDGDFKFDTKVEFGEAGDYPVVGDFNGDGIAQLALYRASTNESLQAMSLPESAPAQATGHVASQFTGEDASVQKNTDQGALPEQLQHHSRSHHTPHSNAPLHR